MTEIDNTQLPETKWLILEREDSVLKIWFNRPEAKNALNTAMTEELVAVLEAVHDDRSVRTIVLRGKGGVFCAGGDIKGFKSDMQAVEPSEAATGSYYFGRRCGYRWRSRSGLCR
jgi:isohexenylglutaconyl-CoA hydratase